MIKAVGLCKLVWRTPTAMANPLVRRLQQLSELSLRDQFVLEQTADRTRQVGAHEDIAREGEEPRDVLIVLSGWACRYKLLPDGRRQIIGFCLPGDLCDPSGFVLRVRDHSMSAIMRMTLAELSRDAFDAITLEHPRVTQALWRAELVNAAIQREWIVSLGQRTALERISHLLCELFIRLRSVGLVQSDSCEFPVTQSEIADAAGLSAVHVNRTLQDLRAADLIRLEKRILTVPDLPALMRAGLFNPNYLHVERNGALLN